MTIPARLHIPTAQDMRTVGADLGRLAKRGDVIVLSGDLGAGKTTLTQGIARGMGIDDHITSPTFVIARAHMNPAGGPDLIHADAYRLNSLDEVLDLDLESDLDHSVMVVEWGEGRVDTLNDSLIAVRIIRGDDPDDDARDMVLTPVSGHWLHDVEAGAEA